LDPNFQLPGQVGALLSGRLGKGGAAPERSAPGPSWDRALARVVTLLPRRADPNRVPVLLQQDSNVPQHLSHRAQLLLTPRLLMPGMPRVVLRRRPPGKTIPSRSRSRHGIVSNLSQERAERK